MHTTTPSAQDVLDAAAAIVIGDRSDALSYARIAQHLGSTPDAVRSVYPVFEILVADLLARETAILSRVVVAHVDRDPRGGLPSRIFSYALSAVYEQPFARTLYLEDPEGLRKLMQIADGWSEIPSLSMHPELMTALQRAGMMRPDVDPHDIAAVIDAIGAGVTLSAPAQQLDATLAGLMTLLERSVDADVDDTTPGKVLLAHYAARLAVTQRRV